MVLSWHDRIGFESGLCSCSSLGLCHEFGPAMIFDMIWSLSMSWFWCLSCPCHGFGLYYDNGYVPGLGLGFVFVLIYSGLGLGMVLVFFLALT